VDGLYAGIHPRSLEKSGAEGSVPQRIRNLSKKLFIGGLSWDTSDQGLRTAFEKFGAISEAKVITDRDTGRSRGFAFITYDDAANADAAIQAMDGTMLDGRNLKVNEAQARSNRR